MPPHLPSVNLIRRCKIHICRMRNSLDAHVHTQQNPVAKRAMRRPWILALHALLIGQACGALLTARQRSHPQPAISSLRGGQSSLLSLRGGQFGLRKHDVAEEVAELFDNMRVPAALVVGAIVPLVSFAGPRADPSDSPQIVFAKQLHFIVAITSLMNALLAVMYATVSFNTLSESHPAPAETVAEVLQRDYELAWLGCNVCFYLGLFGLALTCAINGYIALGMRIVLPTACLLGASMLLMISIVNGAVDQNGALALSWGFERWFGESILALCARYARLLLRTAVYGGVRRTGRPGVSAMLVPILLLWLAFVEVTRRTLKESWSHVHSVG